MQVFKMCFRCSLECSQLQSKKARSSRVAQGSKAGNHATSLHAPGYLISASIRPCSQVSSSIHMCLKSMIDNLWAPAMEERLLPH